MKVIYFCGICGDQTLTEAEAEDCCSITCIKCGELIRGLPIDDWDICWKCEFNSIKN